MRRLGIVGMAALLGAALASPQLARAQTAGVKHYPDLKTLKPSDIHIRQTGCSLLGLGGCTGRELRFSNIVWNAGDGRLEMRPVNNSLTGKTTAYQRIWTHDESLKWSLVEEVQVGEFVFHSSHNHWHFEGFANYSLQNENADGSISASVRRSSQKTTFCVIDTDRIDDAQTDSVDTVNQKLPHSSSQTYTTCGKTSITGLSVGWGDKYGYNLSGQSIDIKNLPDGRYWLVSTANFQGKLKETNPGNNWAAVKLEISGGGTRVKELETKFPS